MERCPPPDVDCLWRVSGYSKALKKKVRHVGLVRAPDNEAALRQAIATYSDRYVDIIISHSPLANL